GSDLAGRELRLSHRRQIPLGICEGEGRDPEGDGRLRDPVLGHTGLAPHPQGSTETRWKRTEGTLCGGQPRGGGVCGSPCHAEGTALDPATLPGQHEGGRSCSPGHHSPPALGEVECSATWHHCDGREVRVPSRGQGSCDRRTRQGDRWLRLLRR